MFWLFFFFLSFVSQRSSNAVVFSDPSRSFAQGPLMDDAERLSPSPTAGNCEWYALPPASPNSVAAFARLLEADPFVACTAGDTDAVVGVASSLSIQPPSPVVTTAAASFNAASCGSSAALSSAVSSSSCSPSSSTTPSSCSTSAVLSPALCASAAPAYSVISSPLSTCGRVNNERSNLNLFFFLFLFFFFFSCVLP